MSAFANLENGMQSNMSNPFNATNVNWGSNIMNGMQQQSQQQQPFANPFRDTSKMNGFSQSFQPIFPLTSVGGMNSTNAWTPNPFKVSKRNFCIFSGIKSNRRIAQMPLYLFKLFG